MIDGDRWRGEVGVVMATGPSLCAEDIEYCRQFRGHGVRLLGCNDAYKLCDDLDILYACDPHWWDHHADDACGLEMWTQDEKYAKRLNLTHIPGKSSPGLSYDPNLIHFGSNSGFQLLNIAWLHNLRPIILLGYNMQVVSRQRHFFGDHPKPLNRNSQYTSFASMFAKIPPKDRAQVINCTTDSKLTSDKIFRFAPLREVLTWELLSLSVPDRLSALNSLPMSSTQALPVGAKSMG
jgi:hypothetical protein